MSHSLPCSLFLRADGARAAALLLLLVSPARADPPFGRLLAGYRIDQRCYGPAFQAANDAVDASIAAYHMADPAQPRSVALGAQAAAQADALAATAAGKRCPAVATELWRFVIRYFDGPAFDAYQRQAVAGMRALRK